MIGLELMSRASPGAGGEPVAVPLAGFFVPGGGRSVAIAEGAGSSISVWTEISPNHAAWMRLDGVDTTSRWSWRETLIAELRNIYPVGDLTLSGSWSRLQSSGSGLSGSYTGNRAVSTTSTTATASVTVGRSDPYDVWIHFTGRTNGGYCRVEIDGAQTLVNEIDDPASLGFKAFPTYSATDLQRRRSVKVASGLTGDHEITFSNGGVATPGGNAILIEAVAITGALTDPRILPPVWQSDTTYESGDEVQFGGLFYSARADGISGTDGPTHIGGINSDGALDWRADNRSTYPMFVAVDYPSEREYAARVLVDGVATEIGGQTHGNEILSSRTVLLDDGEWVPATTGNGLTIGARLEVVEALAWQTGTGVAIADCQLTRVVTPGAINHTVTVTGTGATADFEWLYAGMVPMVAWDGESRSSVMHSLEPAGQLPVILADYEGINPPNLDFPDVQRIGVTAIVNGETLKYGHEAGALPVPGNIVNRFDTFLRPNLNAASTGGGLDWQTKAYVTGNTDDGMALGAGDTLGFFSRHVMHVAGSDT